MIGIVILNYNTQYDTIECVKSITETTNSDYKIYIVDNNSLDNSYINLLNLYSNSKGIEVLKSKINGGYSAGNNIGIKKALSEGAKAVLLSNSDIIYYNNSIDVLFDYLINNENIGIIGPKILLENGCIQNSPRQNYTFKNYIIGKKPFKYFNFNKIYNEVYFKNYTYDKELIFKGLVSGCCIGLSKNYFELCGTLDEGTFLYFEESIIAKKANKLNLLTCLLPSSVVLHKSSLSIGKQNSAFSRYHRYYSSMYMLKKYESINNWMLLLISIINIIPFITKIYNKEYRKYLLIYKNKVLKLFWLKSDWANGNQDEKK